jgi:hypothetical protein
MRYSSISKKRFGWLIDDLPFCFIPGLQVAVKCKNSKGEYESTAVGQVDRSGAFRVPLAAADVVGEDGELKSECFAQLHSASSAPCPGQEPSKIVAAPPGHDANGEKTYVALGGKVYRSSPECASAFLCHPFFHSIMHHHHVGTHKHVVIPHLPVPDHGHGHSGVPVPPVTKPPVDVPEHKPAPVPVPEHKPPSSTPVDTPPSTPVGTPPSTPVDPAPSTPVYSPPKPTPSYYHPPAQRDAATGP